METEILAIPIGFNYDVINLAQTQEVHPVTNSSVAKSKTGCELDKGKGLQEVMSSAKTPVKTRKPWKRLAQAQGSLTPKSAGTETKRDGRKRELAYDACFSSDNEEAKRMCLSVELLEQTKPLFNGGGCGAAPPNPMIALSWNCRGLGNPGTIQALKKMVHQEASNLVFLMETKVIAKQMMKIRVSLGFQHGFLVPSEG